jgi:hypothetical protein
MVPLPVIVSVRAPASALPLCAGVVLSLLVPVRVESFLVLHAAAKRIAVTSSAVFLKVIAFID